MWTFWNQISSNHCIKAILGTGNWVYLDGLPSEPTLLYCPLHMFDSCYIWISTPLILMSYTACRVVWIFVHYWRSFGNLEVCNLHDFDGCFKEIIIQDLIFLYLWLKTYYIEVVFVACSTVFIKHNAPDVYF